MKIRNLESVDHGKKANISKKKYRRLWILFLALFAFAIFAPMLAPHPQDFANAKNSLMPPSMEFWFGSDVHGRDVFSRTLIASRVSILASFFIVLVSGAFGTVIGMLSAYYGKKTDQILMGICDVFLAFPQMIIALGVVGILGGGLFNAILALAISNWMSYARLARSSTLVQMNEEYVVAAKFSGLSGLEILGKHIFVNIRDIIFVTMSLNFATTLMSLAGMGFIGLGVRPPRAEWGSMLNEGRLYLSTAPWISFFPALFIIIFVFVFHYAGETIGEV